MGLSGISLPDPKNSIPSWMKDDIVLLYMSWYREKKANSNQRGRQVANFILRDIKDHVDITQMNGVEFMKAVVAILQKKILSKNMDFTMNTASKDSNGNLSYFYHIFRFVGEDLLIDCTSVKFVGFQGVLPSKKHLRHLQFTSTSIHVNKEFAYAMGWIVDDPSQTSPQLNHKPGRNMMIELRGVGIDQPPDLRWYVGPNSKIENR